MQPVSYPIGSISDRNVRVMLVLFSCETGILNSALITAYARTIWTVPAYEFATTVPTPSRWQSITVSRTSDV